jgi:hypothetical protein
LVRITNMHFLSGSLAINFGQGSALQGLTLSIRTMPQWFDTAVTSNRY